jgi:hypothetical protein
MKNIKLVLLLGLGIMLAIGACTDMDDYLKYTGGKDLIYTGKVDSVHVHAGRDRVVITGLLIADPKITRLRMYWNTRQDSLIMDIDRSEGVDSLNIPIPLPEGRYNFELITYDAEGNKSVTVFSSGASYGALYQESLINRPVRAAAVAGKDSVKVNMYNSDETALYTEIIYTTVADEQKVLHVKAGADSVYLVNIKSNTKFTYQTYYLPEKLAIDTFKAAPQTIGVSEDITNTYIKNPGYPFLRGDAGTGKWGTPKAWLFNPAATNQDGGQGGGWSTDNGGVIHFETKDWGGDGMTNGKVWQTFELPAGTYTASFEVGNHNDNPFTVEELVVKGTELPDVDNLGEPLAVFHGRPNALSGTHKLTFTLDEPTQIAIGWAVSTGQYVYIQYRSIRLSVASSGF